MAENDEKKKKEQTPRLATRYVIQKIHTYLVAKRSEKKLKESVLQATIPPKNPE